MNSIAKLNNVRSQWLSDFSPDDMCPMSTQFFESPVVNSSSGSHETSHHQEGMLIDLGNDHDNFGKASESTETCAPSVPVSDLLSIDQLLEKVVLDPAPQAGVIPVAADMAFKDMTRNCEAPPNCHPNQMELVLFHDPQLPQAGAHSTNSFADDNMQDYPQCTNGTSSRVVMRGWSKHNGGVVDGATPRRKSRTGSTTRSGPLLPAGRVNILEVHSRGKTSAKDDAFEKIARRTPGFTVADVQNLI